MHQHMVRRFVRAVRRLEPDQGPLATLEMARNHVIAMNGAAEVARVHHSPGEFINPTPSPGETITAIRGLESVFATCATRQQMLHESGLVPWSTPAS